MYSSKNYIKSIAILVGTIIGVGLFTIPYVINKAGILALFVYLPVLAIIEYFLLKIYVQVVLSTKKSHRLPGYVEKYFGKKYRFAALGISMLSNYGTLLAYIIIGGTFLHQLLSPILGGGIFVYATILFIIEIFVVLFGLKLIAKVEVLMTVLLVIVIGLIIGRGWGYVDLNNFSLISFENIFLPYGPIFFAIGGTSAVPEICRLLAKEKEKITRALGWGLTISTVITLIFAVMIVGVTGNATTPDTLVGLGLVFGDGITKLALIFGLLSITTSFLIAAQATREVYWWDFKINKTIAWALACFFPYLAYLFGVHDLTRVVSLTGAFTGGILGVLLIWLGIATRKNPEQKSVIKVNINKYIAFGLSFLFVIGLIYSCFTG